MKLTPFGALLLLFAAGAACATSDSSGGADGVGADSDAGLDAPSLGPGFSDATVDGTCDVHCSSDLHSVLDCNNGVVKTCPVDQGCASGGCAAACDSARANKSTIGCEYYSVQPEGSALGGYCFAIYIANTWTTPATIKVDFRGKPYDLAQFARIPSGNGQAITYAPLVNKQVPAGQVAVLFLSDGDPNHSCPTGVNPPHKGANVAGTAVGDAFHVTSDLPVVAYDIYPFGGGAAAVTSSTLLLPTSAWDTNYMSVDVYRPSNINGVATPMALQLVASEDNTQITLRPTSNIAPNADGGVPGATQGQPTTYSLNKGQVLQLTTPTPLNGSPVQANKPIGMWSSMACMTVPADMLDCDSAHQQIPPIKALGNEYVAVRYRNRVDGLEETPPWRIMGVVDGTNLSYEPQAPPGAATSLSAGQVTEFNAAGPFLVKSQDAQHPIYVAAHMTGCDVIGGRGTPNGCVGGPEFVNVIPAQQYLSSYVFFTDPTYPETDLVLTRTKAPNGTFKDVVLDCTGPLTGWQPVGSSGQYEYTRVDLVRHNFAKQGACDNGRHEIHSDLPFALTVWGWGNLETGSFDTQAVSYAYPAGESVLPINTVVVAPSPR